ncbi:MAG TPA: hypothetical protein VG076_04390 [Acidimicrobiales bacterium]|nr:hypothetical protein [Acidimicrobiales bacterium]
MSGTVNGSVNVPTNTTCVISGAHVLGSIYVQPHSAVSVEGSTVDGSVYGLNPSGSVGGGPDSVCLGSECFNSGSPGDTIRGQVLVDGATYTFLCGSSFGSNVTLNRGRFFEVGDPTADEDPFGIRCAGNNLAGLTVTQNADTTPGENPGIEENVTNGSVNIANNTSASRLIVDGNRIGGSLTCSGNTPPPDDLDAGVPDPNTVQGRKYAQCAAL